MTCFRLVNRIGLQAASRWLPACFKHVIHLNRTLLLSSSLEPCRLCPHVIVVMGLKRINDLWNYAVEPNMPARFKVRFQHGGLRHVRVVEVLFRDASVHQTWLCKRTRDAVTPKDDPTSIKKKTGTRGKSGRGFWSVEF